MSCLKAGLEERICLGYEEIEPGRTVNPNFIFEAPLYPSTYLF
jgi:hypothetical protein